MRAGVDKTYRDVHHMWISSKRVSSEKQRDSNPVAHIISAAEGNFPEPHDWGRVRNKQTQVAC